MGVLLLGKGPLDFGNLAVTIRSVLDSLLLLVADEVLLVGELVDLCPPDLDLGLHVLLDLLEPPGLAVDRLAHQLQDLLHAVLGLGR